MTRTIAQMDSACPVAPVYASIGGCQGILAEFHQSDFQFAGIFDNRNFDGFGWWRP